MKIKELLSLIASDQSVKWDDQGCIYTETNNKLFCPVTFAYYLKTGKVSSMLSPYVTISQEHLELIDALGMSSSKIKLIGVSADNDHPRRWRVKIVRKALIRTLIQERE